jgi:hypothetical protein
MKTHVRLRQYLAEFFSQSSLFLKQGVEELITHLKFFFFP